MDRELARGRQREALREVCRRFLRAYGPAPPASFAEWFGTATFRVAETRALFDELAGEVEEVGVDGRACFALAGDRSFEPLDAPVRLLPEYGAYLMGFRERDRLVPQPVRELIAGHRGGRYEGPTATRLVLVDGVAAGLWERQKRGRRIELRVRLTRRTGEATRAELEANRFCAFLGLEPVLRVGSN